MKNLSRFLSVLLILLVQFGSTGFGYYLKSCKDKNTSTLSISKQNCSCKHTNNTKSCCHKKNKKKDVNLKELTCCEIQHFQNLFNNENVVEQGSIAQVKPFLSEIIEVYNKLVTGYDQRVVQYVPLDLIYESVNKNILYQSFLI